MLSHNNIIYHKFSNKMSKATELIQQLNGANIGLKSICNKMNIEKKILNVHKYAWQL